MLIIPDPVRRLWRRWCTWWVWWVNVIVVSFMSFWFAVNKKAPGVSRGFLKNGVMFNPLQHRSTPFAGGCMMMQMMDWINHCLYFALQI